MSQRLRLLDCRLSRLPAALGLCSSDLAGIAGYVNSAERRLITAKEAGDDGWYGTWAEVAFNVTQSLPYVTMPRTIARAEFFNVCDCPVELNNQFFEYLRFGNGRLPKTFQRDCVRAVQVLSRNNAPVFTDLSAPPQYVAVYALDPVDVGARVLVQGRDSTGATIYSTDGTSRVQGIYTSLATPYSTVLSETGSPMPYSAITGIQKDVTQGQIQIYQQDPTTGVQTLLHTMDPGETTGWYRRYYFDALPFDCCTSSGPVSGCPAGVPAGQVQVTALVKLENVPVRFDPDYLTLQNLEAIIEECQAIRYGDMDNSNAKAMEVRHHAKAIGLLNGELSHYMGQDTPAVNFAPFGTARLERVNIGMI